MAKPILAPARTFQADATTLGITWNDGHESRYAVRDLRLACPCAHCIQEWTGEVMVKPETIPADVRPLDLESVGNYGMRVTWSDGHSTGIYTWERLRAFCGCAACGGPKDPLTLATPSRPR
jgi:ATP-binding protein involved in chromosome partitioning